MSADYWIGLATIPAVALGSFLGYVLTGRLVALLGRIHLGVWRRFRPGGAGAERMATVVFGCRKGAMFSLGNFAVVMVTDLDHEKRREGVRRLARTIDIFAEEDVTP